MTGPQRLQYLLSAGRTGTVFLERLINRKFGNGSALHEPSETRYQMMLANLRNDLGTGGHVLSYWFERARARRLVQAKRHYVELNPFLCAMTDLLPKEGYELRVVHAVRDPADWANSITSFRASKRFRWVINRLPFAKPYPSPRPEGWSSMNEYERALWRWRWCNSRISALSKQCTKYTLVRYEDLFSPEETKRLETLKLISATFDLPGPLTAEPTEMKIRINAFGSKNESFDQIAAKRICGALAQSYGYEY